MAMEAPSVLAELEVVCQRLSKVNWQDKDVAQRRKACSMLRNLSIELEESGDLVDRVIYQVNTSRTAGECTENASNGSSSGI